MNSKESSQHQPPEYRRDPISGEVAIIAASRASRPNALRSLGATNTNLDDNVAECPFCRGNEALTPDTLQWYPTGAGNEDWQVRVIPNLYPAVVNEPEDESEDASELPTSGSIDRAIGSHEVVVEGPEHLHSLTELSTKQLLWTLQAYADRMHAHQAAGAAYTQVFKNNGRSAGASLAHAHSQIVSLDRVPPRVEREVNNCRTFSEQSGGCLVCDLLEKESVAEDRVVLEDDDFLVFCPFASRLPYELCILPRNHQPHFWAQTANELAAFARTLYQTVALLEKKEKRLPFNYLIHTAPFDIASSAHYHWHLELVPRFARQAGFEWGTGLHLNPVAPEAAAAEFRNLR